eukprot:UN04238
MSVSRIPANLLDNEDEFQEFTVPDWQLPTQQQTIQAMNTAFKWSDVDTDNAFTQSLLRELQKAKENQQNGQ